MPDEILTLPEVSELEQAAETQGWGEVGAPNAGTTTLDRVHQAPSALYPSGTDEKRWVGGVLAREKGLGL